MIHHRRRLVLRKLTRLTRLRKRIHDYLLQGQQIKQLSHNEEEDDDELSGLSQMPMMAFEDMDSLTAAERRRLRDENKNMPPYLFMSEKEKIEFFKNKNKSFIKKLQTTSPRELKTKKIVKFCNNFQYKAFNKKQPATLVKGTQSFKDTYHPQHFSS